VAITPYREGDRHSITFSFSEENLRQYAQLSGDANPLHTDATFARALKLKGPVVFGGLLLATVSRLIGTKIPGAGCLWHTVSFRFRQPLYAEETASIEAVVRYVQEDLRVLQLAIEIHRAETLIADGTAQVGFPERSPQGE
jgi:3-hydroxybutyryl-CoA dehydratase